GLATGAGRDDHRRGGQSRALEPRASDVKTGRQLVDGYIAAAPAPARPMLRELRRIVRTCAPGAEEKLSYQMPYYHLGGRLTYFAAFKNHVSLFVMGRAKKELAAEMKPYQTSASTLRFPLGSRIPARLVAKLIRGRARELETRKLAGARAPRRRA